MKSIYTSSINASLVTAALATAEQMVFKARMERSAIEFDLRAAYSRIENLQARALGLREQHAQAIDAVDVALERQEALRLHWCSVSIENLQARALGLREQHAVAIDAVDKALEHQAELHRVLKPLAPWMFAVPAGDGPRPVEELTAAQFDQYGDDLVELEAGAQIPADS